MAIYNRGLLVVPEELIIDSEEDVGLKGTGGNRAEPAEPCGVADHYSGCGL
jgi:hypothetical protein